MNQDGTIIAYAYASTLGVYEYNETEGMWNTKGQQIPYDVQGDELQDVVINNNGTRVAMRGTHNVWTYDFVDAQWDYNNYLQPSYWTSRGSIALNSSDYYNENLAMNGDGNVIATTTQAQNYPHDQSRNRAYVYEYSSNNTWNVSFTVDAVDQTDGSSINKVDLDDSGKIVSVSFTGDNTLKVYKKDESWSQIGQTINNPTLEPDNYNATIFQNCLDSSGMFLACLFYPTVEPPSLSHDDRYVKVFKLSNNAWTQIGDDFTDELDKQSHIDIFSFNNNSLRFIIGSNKAVINNVDFMGKIDIHEYDLIKTPTPTPTRSPTPDQYLYSFWITAPNGISGMSSTLVDQIVGGPYVKQQGYDNYQKDNGFRIYRPTAFGEVNGEGVWGIEGPISSNGTTNTSTTQIDGDPFYDRGWRFGNFVYKNIGDV